MQGVCVWLVLQLVSIIYSNNTLVTLITVNPCLGPQSMVGQARLWASNDQLHMVIIGPF